MYFANQGVRTESISGATESFFTFITSNFYSYGAKCSQCRARLSLRKENIRDTENERLGEKNILDVSAVFWLYILGQGGKSTGLGVLYLDIWSRKQDEKGGVVVRY